jgi:hypothetical protein
MPVLIAAVTRPFCQERILVELPACGSISDMLRAIGFDPFIPARVFLDDRIIGVEEREAVCPRPGQTLTVRAVPAGGSTKDTELLTLAFAAVAAAASFGVGAAITAEFGTTVSLTGTSASGAAATTSLTNLSPLGTLLKAVLPNLISSAVSFLGGLAVNALIPPASAPTPKPASTPQAFTVSGGANSVAAYSPIPKIYGARRIFPQYAASPYNEIVGHNQYLRMLFLLGYGPLDISKILIGDTAIENYQDIEWELRSGFTDDAPIRLYPGSVFENDFSEQLSRTNPGSAPTTFGWVTTQTSGPLADELAVDVSFPSGLVAFSGTGSKIHIQCTLQVRWAPTGTTTWTMEPDIVIKSTNKGTTRAGHVWRVPRGQYDVQTQVIRFAIASSDWTQGYAADSFWTALRTIRDQPPYTMAGLSVLALRVRASRQLSGTIENLNCIASSIVPDYNTVTGLWNDRAGGWSYDYDNAGAGASLYALDPTNVHTTTATTDMQFVTDQVIGTGNGSTTFFSGTLLVPSPQGSLTYAVLPGSLILSIGTQASVTASPGTKKKKAAVATLLFISDDGQGNIVGPTVSSGTINYATGAISVTFTPAPANGLSITCDFALIVKTANAGRALAIRTASSSDQAAVVSKSIPVKILPVDGSTGTPPATNYAVSGWYKGSAALTGGVRIRVFWGATEDFSVAGALSFVDVLSSGNATTSWQQAPSTVPAPSGALWMRVAVYHLAAGTNITLYFDDFSVIPSDQGVTAVQELPNPSFDFAGRITTNPASHYRDVLQSRANKLAVADSRLDLTGLQNWWIDNSTNNRNFNAILDRRGTVFDTLRTVVSFGRASFTMRDSLYSIVEDKPQTTPIQHFTPRNSWGFKWTKGFPNLPQALKVRFVNPANNWQDDERIVYDDKPGGISYENVVTSMTPLLYYQMGELSGTTGVDTMGLNNGTYAGSLTLGQAGLLNTDATPSVLINSGGHLNPANIPAVRLNTMSGVFWARQTGTISSFARYAEFDGESVSSPGWALQNDGGTGLGLRLDTSAGVNQLLSFPGHVGDGNVHMIAFAADSGGTMYVSLDGAPWATTSYAVGTGLAQIATVPFQIGAGQTNFKIAHFAYWNRVLANSELANLYAKGAVSIALPYDPTTTLLYEVLDLTSGCTDYVQAWKDARYHLAQGRLRGETFEWFADIENIVCQHGDLVYLTHDVPEFGRGAGRIVSVQLDGSSNCTGITTDELMTFDFGSSYVARIRRSADGTSLLENLNNPAASLGGTVSSTASGVWALASLVISGLDGPPQLRASVLGPSGTSTSAAVTMPSGMQVSDLILVQLGFQANPGTITPPTGWGLLLQSNDSSNTSYQAVLYKLANASEPSTYTFNWTSSVAYHSGAAAFLNVAGAQPLESSVGTGSASAATSEPTPVVAPGAPLNQLVAVFATQNTTGTLALPSTSQLWAPATGLGGWYYSPSSIATGVLAFQTAIPSGQPQPAVGDLVMFGILNAEMNPVLITKIEPGHDLSAKLTAVDYSPAIYNSDSGTQPIFNSQGQASPVRPAPVIAPNGINSTDYFSNREPDGSIQAIISIALLPVSTMSPDAGSILGIEYETQVSSSQGLNNRGTYSSATTYNVSDMVTYNGQNWVAIANGITNVTPGTNGADWTIVTESTPWTQPAEVPFANDVTITGVEAGVSYNVQLRYVFVDGSRSTWTQVTHVVAGQTTVPPDVANLTAAVNLLNKVTLTWSAAKMPNVREYEIRQGTSWAAGQLQDRVRKVMWKSDPLLPGTYTFFVGVIDTSGNYSLNPAGVTVVLSGRPVVNAMVDTPGINPNAVTSTQITDVVSGVTIGLPVWAAASAYSNGNRIADGSGDAQQVVDQKVTAWNVASGTLTTGCGTSIDDFPWKPTTATPSPTGPGISASRPWISQTLALKAASTSAPISRRSVTTPAAPVSQASVVVNVPTGVVNGDGIIFAIIVRDSTVAVTTPAGLSFIRADTNATAGKTWLYYRVASSEPASYTFTLGSSTVCTGGAAAFIGTASGNFIDQQAAGTGTGTTITVQGVTPSQAFDELLNIYSWFNNGTGTSIALTPTNSVTGGSAPTWNTTGNGYTQDNYVLWQNVGAGYPYGVWVTLVTAAITLLSSSDTLHFQASLDNAISNVQPNDEADLQILDAPNYPSLTGATVIDPHMPIRALITSQSGLNSSAEGAGPSYTKKLTGFSSGAHTFVLQQKLIMGGTSHPYQNLINNAHFDVADVRR